MRLHLVAFALVLACGGESTDFFKTAPEPPPDSRGGHFLDGTACRGAPMTRSGFSKNLLASESGVVAAETSITGDAKGNVLLGYIEINPVPTIRIARSTDGGNAFALQPAFVVENNPQQSDPMLTTLSDGTMLAAFISFAVQGASPSDMHVPVFTSTDTGKSWSKPVFANDGDDGAMVDKPWLASGPDGAAALCYLTIVGNESIRVRARLRGADGKFGKPIDLSETSFGLRNLCNAAYGPGGELYVAWVEIANLFSAGGEEKDLLDGSEENHVLVARVDKGGSTVASRVVASGPEDQPVFSQPSVAVAPDGTVYVAYTSGFDNHTDVMVARSRDRATTFDAPARVNDDVWCATHFLPQIAVDAKGRVHVTFLDNRDGKGHAAYAVSADGGQSFGANTEVTDVSFKFNLGREPVTTWLGDYTHLTRVGDTLLFGWADPRSGKSGSYFSRLDVR